MKLKKNLLLLGTTSYGEELSISDQNKFNELNSEFNVFVFTLGTSSKTKKFSNVTIEYTKKPKFIYFQYLKFFPIHIIICSKRSNFYMNKIIFV